MKSVAILGSSGVVKGASFLNTADFLSSVGHNTGNLVFQYAVYNAITEPKLIVGIDIPWDPKVIRDRCRVLVLPVANFIRENFDLTGYVNFLEACNLPLVFIGLGAQADDYNKIDFNFHPSILKLIELMKGMDCRVAVRGIYTKNVLNKYGVLNSHIMGCPSNFLNKDDNLHEKLEKKWKSPVRTLSATGDEPWPKNGTKKLAEQKLISLTKEMGAFMFSNQ